MHFHIIHGHLLIFKHLGNIIGIGIFPINSLGLLQRVHLIGQKLMLTLHLSVIAFKLVFHPHHFSLLSANRLSDTVMLMAALVRLETLPLLGDAVDVVGAVLY
jgi:hypothetical protein